MTEAQQPLSPHLQIYKPQLTSVLSITHRATGVFLAFGALLFALWLVSVAAGGETYSRATRLIGTWYGQIFLYLFVFSLHYHLCNGIRHLFWDIGRGLDISMTYLTGYLAVGGAVALTVATWLLGGGA